MCRRISITRQNTRSITCELVFKQNGIVDKLYRVFSSHKRRAALTVEPTARLKVQQFPRNGQELNPENNGPSVCPTVVAIQSLPLGSTVLVATHTRTIYQIMGIGTDDCDGMGLDNISNELIFPKDENVRLSRDQYSNVGKYQLIRMGKQV